MTIASHSLQILDEPAWRQRQRAHEERVRRWTDPHQARAARGEKHPVYDFLFTYYAFRPAWLRRWHPGLGLAVAGEGAREFLRWPEHRNISSDGAVDGSPTVVVEPAALAPHRREFVGWLRSMLSAMQTRPAFFGCHGLHEWAMVYRQTPEAVRHNAYPLRFPADEIARILETSPVCCTHFDAFRFFTPAARRLNKLQPTRGDTSQLEQRG